ncbi:MAG: AAA family ATPase, partial [Candidatus Levybacteria bacterium]|nr:AAA family ATPase [Candidatus Levybacteria bacterium]
MKSFTSFVCQECGYDSPEWLGKCPECGNWNSFREIKTGSLRESVSTTSIGSANLEPKRISQIKFEKKERLSTSFSEADTVLGGGIVRGSVTLLAGDPGIGKSTLLLQIAMNIAGTTSKPPRDKRGTFDTRGSVLYISGEESEEQIKMRALRLRGGATKDDSKSLLLISLSNINAAVEVIENVSPSLVIIDSIQTMES